jgi:hypothetical protein
MLDHVSFHTDPPSREVLMEWLKANEIHVHPALRIMDMDEGTGWMVEAGARIPEGEMREPPDHYDTPLKFGGAVKSPTSYHSTERL